MALDVILGLQWGDEGKGKIVDVLTKQYDIIARFQGGPNAGHTLIFDDKKYVLHTIPSGIFHPNSISLIGNGVVVNPAILQDEIDTVAATGVDVYKQLIISERTHLILPTHTLLDLASEMARGKEKIGSTLKGISPTYIDRVGRNGLRAGDIHSSAFKDKYNKLKERHIQLIKNYRVEIDIEARLNELEDKWFEGVESIKKLQCVSCEIFLNQALSEGKKVMAEGAQGTLLDIDFGTYPYVTSSNTISSSACTGLGIAPTHIGEIYGIFKAYTTRVGAGPFPTELFDDTGTYLRDAGHEYGATTGRERRCGWLDLPLLRYAAMLNGVTKLIMMKADVLSGLDSISVCTHYHKGNQNYSLPPYDLTDTDYEPVYRSMKGWKEDLTNCKDCLRLPDPCMDYIEYIEHEMKLPVAQVSVGPDRVQVVDMNK